MPKCEINGKEIEVPEGTSVIEAFKMMGEEIAHYCWHPGLSVAGACRLCLVDIQGAKKLEIACNTPVKDGMVVSNQTEKVKNAVRWGLDFHLINHPLDCPICDQAGECGLQDQYMQFGKYDPEMAERKVKKRKVVDLGSKIVLDTERCILCSRCVRFTDEVTQTHEFGIFHRADHSEIGTFNNQPVENNYALNTVDICPVGALTSKDFRFRQRVWYLKEADTVCPGCSTGCNVRVYHNEEGLWRVRPNYNPDINGHWMCDEGRPVYKFVNRQARLLFGRAGSQGNWERQDAGKTAKNAGAKLRAVVDEHGPESVALVLTGQYTTEEYEDIVEVFANRLGSSQVYHWVNNPETFDDFDGILCRGDKNPNTNGLKKVLKEHNLTHSWEDLENKLAAGKIKAVVVAGPENQGVFPDMEEKVQSLSRADNIIWLTAGWNQQLEEVTKPTWQIPLKTYFEKDGTFINYQGIEQEISKGTTVVASALTLSEAAILLSGGELAVDKRPASEGGRKKNYFTEIRGAL